MRTKTILLAALVLAAFQAIILAEAKPPVEIGLVIYKLGEVNANDDMAKKPIDDFAAYLSGKIDGAKFVRRGVRNKPDDALKLMQDEKNKAGVAIVSPGFYFAHKDYLKLTALAEARRGGFDGEQYVLRGKTAAEGYPYGKRVATSLDADAAWLNNVVLPYDKAKGKPIEWVHYDNLMDAAYAIVDGEKNAPDFVLLDRVSAKAIAADADLKDLKEGAKSEVLPQDLVVEIDGRLADKRDAFKETLAKLDQSEEGKKLGTTLQTATFPAVDEKRLAAAQTAFKKE